MNSQKFIIQTPSQQQSSNFSTNGYTSIALGLSLIPYLFVIFLVFAFFKHHQYQKSLYEKSLNFKRLSENPCFNCKFFANNQEFNCAVQPDVVLTSQAADCRDYSAKYRKYLN